MIRLPRLSSIDKMIFCEVSFMSLNSLTDQNCIFDSDKGSASRSPGAFCLSPFLAAERLLAHLLGKAASFRACRRPLPLAVQGVDILARRKASLPPLASKSACMSHEIVESLIDCLALQARPVFFELLLVRL